MRNIGTYQSGPCYSNVSLIKRCLYQSTNGKLTYPEIIDFVDKYWTENVSKDKDEGKRLVELALYAPKSFFVEDENGLWGLKSQQDERLNPIIAYVKNLRRPFKLKEILRKFKSFNNERELKIVFLQDIRFTELEGTPFWLLSQWELINDQVYHYMQKKRIKEIGKVEIENIILEKYKIEKENLIFFPEVDARFVVENHSVFVDLELNSDEVTEIQVPENIRENLARKSLKILDWIDRTTGEFKIKLLISDIFELKTNDSFFPVYYQAMEDFLSTIPSLLKVKKGTWINVKESPVLNIKHGTHMNYAVHNSVPVIDNGKELLVMNMEGMQEKTNDMEENRKAYNPKEQGTPPSYAYTTISYYERVKGYLVLPLLFSQWFNFDNRKLSTIVLSIEGFNYDSWAQVKDNKVYCYGTGIFDLYSDFLIEPGRKLKISFNDERSLVIDLLDIDERYALEQQRYLDIGRLVEESKRVNKSIFSIMCEVMATYPSGMHWTTLLDEVNKIRTTTKNTITNLLSKNDCFVNIRDKKGYWQLNIGKLSGYYIDEDNQSVRKSFDSQDMFPIDDQSTFNKQMNNSSSNEGVKNIVEDDEEIQISVEDLQRLDSKVEEIIPTIQEKDVHEIGGTCIPDENGNFSQNQLVEKEREMDSITTILEVGQITSRKKNILSFINTKNKQVNEYPFILKNGTETNGEKDGFYNYNYHWDLRNGHDIEDINGRFPVVFPYHERESHKLKDISEAQYTELMKYKIYCLIKEEKLIFKKYDHNRVVVKWLGNDMNPPDWYPTLMEITKESPADFETPVGLSQNINSLSQEDSLERLENNRITKLNTIESETEQKQKDDQDTNHNDITNRSESGTILKQGERVEEKGFLTEEIYLEEIRKLKSKIDNLEKKVVAQDGNFRKFNKTIKILIGVGMGIGVTALLVGIF